MNKKTKIVYIINSLVIGGSEKVLLDNYACLDRNKYEPFIICLSPFNKDNSVFSIVKTKYQVNPYYLDYDFDDDYSVRGYLKILTGKKSLRKKSEKILHLLNELSPGILHLHTSPRELPIGKIFKEAHPDTKLVFTDHLMRIDLDRYGKLRRSLLHFCFRKLYSGFNTISVSKMMFGIMSKENIHDGKKINIVIENGVNFSFIKNLQLHRDNTLRIIYVSRLIQLKGHETLFEAWNLLKDIKNKELLIVGPDSSNGDIQRIAKELNCENVIFTGSSSDPYEYIIKSAIGVFPSTKEGLPLALLEKMAVGLPMVVSNIPELTAIVKDGETALVFQLGNPTDLANKIRMLIKDEVLRKSIGSNGKKLIEQRYNSEHNGVKLQKFYKEIESES